MLGEIADDMAAPHPMNRLLQGDVGSGKTIVAAEAAVIAIENGYQVAVLAPTEILATQHYLYFKQILSKLGYVTVLLTGSFTGREKAQLKKLVAEGLAHVAIGTHALLEKDVEFKKLGLAIIDEQHRFGVLQRLGLVQKGVHPGRAGDDRDAHPAHAGADALRRPGRLASSTSCRPAASPSSPSTSPATASSRSTAS